MDKKSEWNSHLFVGHFGALAAGVDCRFVLLNFQALMEWVFHKREMYPGNDPIECQRFRGKKVKPFGRKIETRLEYYSWPEATKQTLVVTLEKYIRTRSSNSFLLHGNKTEGRRRTNNWSKSKANKSPVVEVNDCLKSNKLWNIAGVALSAQWVEHADKSLLAPRGNIAE